MLNLLKMAYHCFKTSIKAQKAHRIKEENKNLVEFSVDFTGMKLFKEVPELQSINGNNLCASPLPFISETVQRVKGVYATWAIVLCNPPEMCLTVI